MTTDRGALGLVKGLDLVNRPTPPLGCCPRCKEPTPLISTMAFRKAEFYCLECGGHFGFLAPRAFDPTPELNARYDSLKAEWDEHVKPRLRIMRGWWEDCDRCIIGHNDATHDLHATDEEREAHDAALEWLKERVSR